MSDVLAEVIRAQPDEAFREPPNRLASLSHEQRLRWLQQTAYFVWRHGGAARGATPEGSQLDHDAAVTGPRQR